MSSVGVLMSSVGGTHEFRGGCSWVPWGALMSSVGGTHEFRGGTHEFRGGR